MCICWLNTKQCISREPATTPLFFSPWNATDWSILQWKSVCPSRELALCTLPSTYWHTIPRFPILSKPLWCCYTWWFTYAYRWKWIILHCKWANPNFRICIQQFTRLGFLESFGWGTQEQTRYKLLLCSTLWQCVVSKCPNFSYVNNWKAERWNYSWKLLKTFSATWNFAHKESSSPAIRAVFHIWLTKLVSARAGIRSKPLMKWNMLEMRGKRERSCQLTPTESRATVKLERVFTGNQNKCFGTRCRRMTQSGKKVLMEVEFWVWTNRRLFSIYCSLERKGLKFFSETRELCNINLSLDYFCLSATLQNACSRVGHIFVKSSQCQFKQSVFFNGQSLQVKFHTQTARLDCRGKLSLRE